MVSAPAPASPPVDRHEYELRFAGIRAHNRWVADFARDLPGRRAGLAQIFLSDVDDTIAEVKRARADGLVGVLLPPDHFSQLQNVYWAKYKPLWDTLEDLDMSIGRHGVIPGEAHSPEAGNTAAIGTLEVMFFCRRVLTALIIGGIFERHPKLKFVITEAMGSWVPGYLAGLDGFIEDAKTPGSISSINGGPAAKELKMKPSEYFAKHCYVASFFTDSEMAKRYEIGVDRMMWGSDFPHHEGTAPHTHLAYRRNFAGLPENEVRLMLGATAAKVYGFSISFRAWPTRSAPASTKSTDPSHPTRSPAFPMRASAPPSSAPSPSTETGS
jgi:predicted TIM-barrel fold metal-dependent hydrolase